MKPKVFSRIKEFQPPGKDWASFLKGLCPDGVLNRVLENGGPPDKGPGRYSVCRRIRALLGPDQPQRNDGVLGRPRRTKRRHF